MSGPAHDRAQLGAYAIGALDPAEARMVHDHLNGCRECQREVQELMMIRRALDQVPPEAFLDGPPEHGDLLLRRTLRRVATETEAAAPPRRRMTGVYVAAAAAVVVALGGGIVLGRQTAPTDNVAGPTFTVATTPSNARIADATDSETGATMNVALEPKKGWVWVDATATGLPEGKPCALYVISKEGDKVLAGTWQVSAEGAKRSRLAGMALVSPDDVKAITIETMGANAEEVVSVPI
ncbi:anti-sigma factor [Actinophytocola oryzae]|uniref:Putative zinc finger protein n=1 Tax=Actinophytocola oryzae TaxID=502181 RepID=A0A4R7W0C9_9PSEU|nr:zf-HC2 domain-containing protein [Actinophytocola oryzae]TDV55408.1 putative zinc finger protein [Actinophytocola oryzae]